MGGPIQTTPANTSAQPVRPGLRSGRREAPGPFGTTRTGGPAGPGLLTMKAVNARPARLADTYHALLNMPWAAFIGVIVAGYVLANVFYATIYTLIPDAINGSHGFFDNFFFSVQTWATIGYGGMTPNGHLANTVVVVESMTGIFGVALLTGLLFAKFSRPDARVLFANKMVISMYNGKPTLMLRLANERGSTIVEANAHMTLIREERTAEGHVMRRIHDVQLVRDVQPLFRLSWTLMHVIDEKSPLWGLDAERARDSELRMFVNIMGYDSSVGQTAHASAGYGPDELVFGARYKDSTRVEGAQMLLDYALFHSIEEAPLPAGALGTTTTTTVATPLPPPETPSTSAAPATT